MLIIVFNFSRISQTNDDRMKFLTKKTLALPRNTKCVCESLKKQNTKINIDFDKSNKNTMKKV